MNKKSIFCSLIATIIVILASFSSVVCKDSNNEELVEIEVELHGLNKNHNVKLTKEEINEIKLLFDEIRDKFDDAESRAEGVCIFDWAVEELDKYGILGDLSIEQAKSLVNGKFIHPDIDDIYEEFQKKSGALKKDVNALCFVVGRTTSAFYGPTIKILSNIGFFSLLVLGHIGISLALTMILTYVHMKLPISLCSTITYGGISSLMGDPVPSEGWVNTNGLGGNINSTTPIWGKLLRIPLFVYVGLLLPGITGFTGIKSYIDNESYYIGFALLSKLGSRLIFP